MEYIIPYLEGGLTEEERRAFEERMAASDTLRRDVAGVRAVLQKTGQIRRLKEVRTMENWQTLLRRINRRQFLLRVWNISRNAAAVLLLPALLLSYFYLRSPHTERTVEWVETVTAPGLLSKIVLPDSSSVWLNAGTKISYPTVFDAGVRRVKLSGEAYFKVTADAAHRFEVTVPDGLTVSAYGTEFNVCAYENDDLAEVSLARGHIAVSVPNAAAKDLRVSQTVLWDKKRPDNGLYLSGADLNEKTAWKDGKMIFRRTPFGEVVKRLSRRFNVEITVQAQKLYEYEYTATFTAETLPEILSLLEKSSPIRCRLLEPEKQEDWSYAKRKVIVSPR